MFRYYGHLRIIFLIIHIISIIIHAALHNEIQLTSELHICFAPQLIVLHYFYICDLRNEMSEKLLLPALQTAEFRYFGHLFIYL